MSFVIYLGILFSIGLADCVSIPFIGNVTLIPRYTWNTTTVTSHTIQKCFCLSSSSFVAFNWYPNNTCQLFSTFPRTYKIQRTPDARLYFPQGIFPDASQCCMSDARELVEKINTADRISVYIVQPRCLTFDNHGYLVTVSDTENTISRFYSTNLTIVAQPPPPIFDQTSNSITYHDEKYFVGFDRFILILNSSDFTILQNITAAVFDGIRDMAFLDNGQTLLVLSVFSQSLVFLNQSNHYSLITAQNISCPTPHGLHIVNDNLFYVASWNENSIFSYSRGNRSMLWMEQLLIDSTPIASTEGGSHLTIDDCDRVWFSLASNGMKIFNSEGSFLENVPQTTPFIFDTIIADNYVLYISDVVNHRIVRIDPNIQC